MRHLGTWTCSFPTRSHIMVRRIRRYITRLAVCITAFFLLLSVCTRRLYHDITPSRPPLAMATPFDQKDVVVQGYRLRYIDEGSGPCLLGVHGHTSRIEEYDEITKILKQNFRVLIPDLPGSGYSDKPDREYSMDFYVGILEDFLDARGVDKCYLFGFSQGGNAVMRLALRSPERFPRIVVGAPGGAWEAKPYLATAMRVFGGPALFQPVVRIQSYYWFREGWRERDERMRLNFAYYDEVLSPGFVRMYWEIAADQVGSSLFDFAAEVRQPTLLLVGSEDRALGVDKGIRRLQAIMPHAELRVFDGVGHALAAEVPREVAMAMVVFLKKPNTKKP